MKIIFFVQMIDLEDDIRGFIHGWAEALASRVDKLYIIALMVGKHEFKRDNIVLYSLGKEKGFSRIRIFYNFNRIILDILRKDDIDIIFTHMTPLYSVISAPYSLLFRVPIVTWYTHRQVTTMLRLAHVVSKKIVTASTESYGISSRKVVVAGHGIDTNLFRPCGGGSMKGMTHIISVGRLSPIKNHETFISAIDILVNQKGIKNIKATIVGGIPEKSGIDYEKQLKEQMKLLKLEDRVEFAGSVPFKDIMDYYCEGDIFYNGCPTGGLDKAVLEAMACGKIVFTSNMGFKSLLGNDLTFRAGDSVELADKMLALLHLHMDKRHEIGTTLRKMVVKEYSIHRLMEKLAGELRSVSRLQEVALQ